MLTKLSVAASILVCASSVAQAGNVPAVKDACEADVNTYCAEVRPGEGRLAGCLKEHEDELSSECTTALNAAKEACEGDIQTYCADVEPGGGRVADCLRKHRDQISDDCRNVMPRRR
jgi:hypothetical protein